MFSNILQQHYRIRQQQLFQKYIINILFNKADTIIDSSEQLEKHHATSLIVCTINANASYITQISTNLSAKLIQINQNKQ